MFEAKYAGHARKPRFLLQHPELRIGKPIRVLVLRRGGRYGLSGPVLVLGIDDDVGCAMIERLHHLAFVERHPVPRRTGKAVTANRICAFPLL